MHFKNSLEIWFSICCLFLFSNLFLVFLVIADPRVRNMLFMSNPFAMFGILAVYLYFILKWGPAFMKNRKPFNLNKIIIAYNIIQIVACARLVIQVNHIFLFSLFLSFCVYCEMVCLCFFPERIDVVRDACVNFLISNSN